MRRPTPETDPKYRPMYARECARLLRTARDYAIKAGAPRTAARIRLALTSCGGAIRHAEGRAGR